MIEMITHFLQGGISRGLFLESSQLPEAQEKQSMIIANLLGVSASDTQGTHDTGSAFHASRICIVNQSPEKNEDIQCDFRQRNGSAISKEKFTCGNLIYAAYLFTIMSRLALIEDSRNKVNSDVSILDVNTGMHVEAKSKAIESITDTDQSHYSQHVIAALYNKNSIQLTFSNYIGTKTQRLLPTSKPYDLVDDILISCIDAASPMIIVHAKSLQKTGAESPAELNSDKHFLEKLEKLRCAAALKMNMPNAEDKILPKICLISSPSIEEADIQMRYFTPYKCHTSYSVTASICLAVACTIEGTLAHKIIASSHTLPVTLMIQHPDTCNSIYIDENMNAITQGNAAPIFSGKIYIH